jgi:hypothetical protein
MHRLEWNRHISIICKIFHENARKASCLFEPLGGGLRSDDAKKGALAYGERGWTCPICFVAETRTPLVDGEAF